MSSNDSSNKEFKELLWGQFQATLEDYYMAREQLSRVKMELKMREKLIKTLKEFMLKHNVPIPETQNNLPISYSIETDTNIQKQENFDE